MEMEKAPSDLSLSVQIPPCGGCLSRHVFLNRLDASDIELAFAVLKLLRFSSKLGTSVANRLSTF
jgi:hypothetical protein